MSKEFTLPEEILEEILKRDIKTIMLLGASDSGKTTLVEQLAILCSSQRKTAILDVDPGQSHIGPPCTIGWAIIEDKFEGWDKLKMENFYFIGDNSPFKNLLPTVTGARLMQDKAAKVADKIIVDTPGLVRGDIGRALNLHLIDLLKPQIVIALYKEDELEHILGFFHNIKSPKIIKIPVPSEIKRKDFSERIAYRKLKFKNYFREAKEIEFLADEIGLSNDFSPEYLNLRLVSLRDKNNEDIALGIIKNFDKINHTLLIYSPISTPEKVGTVVLGKIRLTFQGEELRT